MPTLLDVAAGAGLVRGRAEEMLRDDEGLVEVRATGERARRLGIEGVPFFVINSATSLSGAREVSAFLDALARVDSAVADGGRSCRRPLNV